MAEKTTENYGTEPRYTVAEAARLVRATAQTLSRWVRGSSEGPGRASQPPLIRLDDPDGKYLSFFNLIEASFLAAYRRERTPMQRVRLALDYSVKELGIARPLLRENFKTDGRNLFYNFGKDALVNVSRSGQYAWPVVVEQHFRKLDFDREGPILMWLFDARKTVAVNPRVSFGAPIIAGRGIRTEIIAERFIAEEDPREIAEDFDLTEEEVWDALRWENTSSRMAA